MAFLNGDSSAPCGSAIRAVRPTPGMSYGASITLPPFAAAAFAVASTSSTETYEIQCDGWRSFLGAA